MSDDLWKGIFIGAGAVFLVGTETGRSILGLGAKATQKGVMALEKKYLTKE